MGDLNKYIYYQRVRTFFYKLGLRELIIDKHRSEVLASTTSNNEIHAIDGIWVSPGIDITEVVYLPFHTGVICDHIFI